jgi:hypothetical protein
MFTINFFTMPRLTVNQKQIQTFRVREELKLTILKTIHNFKSVEEPKRKINSQDVTVALSELLHSKILKNG